MSEFTCSKEPARNRNGIGIVIAVRFNLGAKTVVRRTSSGTQESYAERLDIESETSAVDRPSDAVWASVPDYNTINKSGRSGYRRQIARLLIRHMMCRALAPRRKQKNAGKMLTSRQFLCRRMILRWRR